MWCAVVGRAQVDATKPQQPLQFAAPLPWLPEAASDQIGLRLERVLAIHAHYGRPAPRWLLLEKAMQPGAPSWPEQHVWPLPEALEAELWIRSVDRIPDERLGDWGLVTYRCAAGLSERGWVAVADEIPRLRRVDAVVSALRALQFSDHVSSAGAPMVSNLLTHADNRVAGIAVLLAGRLLRHDELPALRDRVLRLARKRVSAGFAPSDLPWSELTARPRDAAPNPWTTMPGWRPPADSGAALVQLACWLGDAEVAKALEPQVLEWARGLAEYESLRSAPPPRWLVAIGSRLSPKTASKVFPIVLPCLLPPDPGPRRLPFGCGTESSPPLSFLGCPDQGSFGALAFELVGSMGEKEAAAALAALADCNGDMGLLPFARPALAHLPGEPSRIERVQARPGPKDFESFARVAGESVPELHVRAMEVAGELGDWSIGLLARCGEPFSPNDRRRYVAALGAVELSPVARARLVAPLVLRCELPLHEALDLLPSEASADPVVGAALSASLHAIAYRARRADRDALAELCSAENLQVALAAACALTHADPEAEAARAFFERTAKASVGGADWLLFAAAALGVDTPSVRALASRDPAGGPGAAACALRWLGLGPESLPLALRTEAVALSRHDLDEASFERLFAGRIDTNNLRLLTHGSSITRCTALLAVAEMPDWRPEIESLVVAATADDDPRVRLAAYGALATRDQARCVGAWLRHARVFDPDPAVRAGAR